MVGHHERVVASCIPVVRAARLDPKTALQLTGARIRSRRRPNQLILMLVCCDACCPPLSRTVDVNVKVPAVVGVRRYV